MIENVLILILFLTGGGTVAFAEVRLYRIDQQKAITAAERVQMDRILTVLSKRADNMRDHLTKEDVVFLRTNGWAPAAPKHLALAAGVQPPDGLGMTPIPILKSKPPAASLASRRAAKAEWLARDYPRRQQENAPKPELKLTTIKAADGRDLYVLEEEL